jgi:hypothetical protein
MAAPGSISNRMGGTVQGLMPLAARLGTSIARPGDINLARGENDLIKDKMVEICKQALNNNVTTEVSG